VRVSNLMSYLSREVESSAQAIGQEQTPYFDFDQSQDFPVALLRGGKGLPTGGQDAVEAEIAQQMQAIVQVMALGERSVAVGGDNSGSIVTG